MSNISLGDVKAMTIPVPPRAEQARIVEEADRLISNGEATESVVANEIVRLARLRQAILKWAFEGRLVEQDPLDECAVALLERIAKERPEVGGSTKKKRAARGKR